MTNPLEVTTGLVVDVAAIQLAAQPGEVSGNLERLVDLVRRHGPDVDLVVTPELATTGYDLDLFRERGQDLAEPLSGPSVQELRAAAIEVGVTV
ncbi:MAG: carbon-nitrogen hydrolase family protein, partial [Actinomycetes bacterium]